MGVYSVQPEFIILPRLCGPNSNVQFSKPGIFVRSLIFLVPGLIAACTDVPWNSPYPSADRDASIYYDTFTERPKHLDPVSSYSESEARFTAQIYEPVVQYHFLKRPYQLETLTATSLPEPV